jgi:hypothetical protein
MRIVMTILLISAVVVFALWLSLKFRRTAQKLNVGHREREEMLYNGG